MSDNIVNSSKNKVCAIIAAGGAGTRMKMNINKQYIDLDGIPVLARTIMKFESCECVNEIIVVVNPIEIQYCTERIIDKYKLKKVSRVVAGGKERQDSVYNGIKESDETYDMILIHDGARPFIEHDEILACINAAEKYGAACVAVPVKDTIKVIDNQGFVEKTLDRKYLMSIQTPQTFKREVIIKAFEEAKYSGFFGTDDSSLVERLGIKVKLILGSYKNIKITTKDDLIIAKSILQNNDLLKP